jgi:hypothetical protein
VFRETVRKRHDTCKPDARPAGLANDLEPAAVTIISMVVAMLNATLAKNVVAAPVQCNFW